MLTGAYDPPLVLLSLAVPVLASYAALSLIGGIHPASPGAAQWRFCAGAGVLGAGMWSLHSIGIQAFRMPIPLGYDLPRTLFALAIAIACSICVMWLVRQRWLPLIRLSWGAVLLGTGITAVNYIGMDALLMWPGIRYSWCLVLLSLLIAIGLSGLALWIAFHVSLDQPRVVLYRSLAALFMGGAGAGMHYVGMAAASFPANSISLAATIGIPSSRLLNMVAILTLAWSLGASMPALLRLGRARASS